VRIHPDKSAETNREWTRHGGQAANKVGNYKINCPSYSNRE